MSELINILILLFAIDLALYIGDNINRNNKKENKNII